MYALLLARSPIFYFFCFHVQMRRRTNIPTIWYGTADLYMERGEMEFSATQQARVSDTIAESAGKALGLSFLA